MDPQPPDDPNNNNNNQNRPKDLPYDGRQRNGRPAQNGDPMDIMGDMIVLDLEACTIYNLNDCALGCLPGFSANVRYMLRAVRQLRDGVLENFSYCTCM
jgi:hypothetical protein